MTDLLPSSAYIHIPFCKRKCAYCDFLSFASSEELIGEYVDALLREISLTPSWFSSSRKALKTIYFGGGTPSLLPTDQVRRVLDALSEVFGISDDCEITLEVNPGTVDEAKLRSYRKAGINRLSLGIQSLDDTVLSELGRIHDAKTAKAAVIEAKRAGFTNISCDMMLGIPGQTLESVRETVRFLTENNIPHISLYSLILEEGTPMYARYGGDIEKYVTQEQDREMYHLVLSDLVRDGYIHYEISNMAKPGYESRHNTMYWRAEPYYAFGAGAHYYLDGERGRHAETIKEYIEALSRDTIRKEEVCFTEEILTEEDKKKEFMMLGFRRLEGVGERAFLERFGVTLESAFGKELSRETEKGMVTHGDGVYRLTEKGVDLANQVFIDYI